MMLKSRKYRALALASALFILPACNRNKSEDANVAEQKVEAPRPAPSEVFARHVAMLPPDPIMVGYVDMKAVFSPQLEMIYAPDGTPEQLENLEKMRQEISVIFLSNFGVDISGADGVLVVANEDGAAIVLEGVTLPGENQGKTLEASEIAGETVYTFVDDNNASFPKMFMRASSDKAGVVLYSSREVVERVAAASETEVARMGAVLEQWEGKTSPKVFFAVDLQGGALAQARAQIEEEVGRLPDQVILSFEERTLVRMIGPEDEMKGLANRIDAAYKLGTAAFDAEVVERAKGNPFSESLAVMGSFLMLNYGMYLEKYELQQGSLLYSFPEVEARYIPSLLSMGAAIAIPAFLRATKKSKTSEAYGVMATLTERVRMKVAEASTPGGCKLPPAAGPSSEVPVGGAKVIPDLTSNGWEQYDVASLGLEQGAYFSYRIVAVPAGEGSELTYGDPRPAVVVEATADFQEGGPMHTVRQVIFIDADSDCQTQVAPSYTMNEFE